MNKFLSIALAVCILPLSGCSNYQKAESAYTIVNTVVTVAQADLPLLQAAGIIAAGDAISLTSYLNGASALNSQYKACIDNAQQATLSTKQKFVDCLGLFVKGLQDPAMLSSLRVMSPKAQTRAQLILQSIFVAVNGALQAEGSPQAGVPAISPNVSAAELKEFQHRVRIAGGF